jgi:sporulation protein YlmC with PRC-barrel domain
VAKQEVKIELLLGRRVFGLNGRAIGRLEEVKAEVRKGQGFVTEFHVGSYAALERLAGLRIGRTLLHFFHLRSKGGGYRVAWQQMDFSDPKRPRLRCEVKELPRLIV